MFDLILRGAMLVDANGERHADIAIVGHRIAALLAPDTPAETRATRDVHGLVALPGFVDTHVHLCDPGYTHKEDFESGTRAAALGGVTTLLDMPTDSPITTHAAELREKMALASGRIHVDVGFQVAKLRDHPALDDVRALDPVSFELFMAGVPEAYRHDTQKTLVDSLTALKPLNTLACISPGDHALQSAPQMHTGRAGLDALLASRPPVAEAAGIAHAVLASAATGTRVHLRQGNSKLGIDTWRRLRDLADVSIETTPQALLLTEDSYDERRNFFKALPPLRPEGDRAALLEAVREGLIDMIVTDHAPHAHAEKAAHYDDFRDVPSGMPGVQTFVATMLHLVDNGDLTLRDLARLCACNPAQRFGLAKTKGLLAPGYDADLLLLDPKGSMTLRDGDQRSKARYTPFDGLHVSWALKAVYLRGALLEETGAARGVVVTASA
ncbi:dihydroorotase family protein [Caballeronia sp. LZ032]|uniref:dihydroorotase n=1 Tax=Caballeronia sp. LZ032 TaxID=3038565 RepID=UPI0028580570|nr:dihydroorotase family protein [Caballeronia sp. LZ032]MDR5880406.1 dihydroorotase family protein [Caballeronia sp. LZ032]